MKALPHLPNLKSFSFDYRATNYKNTLNLSFQNKTL